MRSLSFLTVAFAFMGCDEPATEVDASLARDAASAEDAGPRDAGLVDAGLVDAGDAAVAPRDAGPPMGALPPANGPLDYQLGASYPPPAGVVVLARDREARPAEGLYTICYVNGFQTQPHERAFWEREHPDLLLRDGSGALVIDPDWDEILLDVRTPERRAALATVVGGWIDGCADAGFDAIEIDNLDTYARSSGLIREDDAVAFMRLLSDRAHARGLPIAQKNSAEIVSRRAAMGTDFAVVEECNRWDECDVFTGAYGDHVYVIEYRRADFDRGCRDFPQLSIVLRDLNLVAPGSAGYVYDGC
ncbi:MAG: endo alpha-1,4 polygalactosaminidase [Sandaracinaceae bacterium]|nr:endo alpha-1,4 polygalactosaminidase [Sandaracinaceae bacterium]